MTSQLRKLVVLDATAGSIAAIVLFVVRAPAPVWLGLSAVTVDLILLANASYATLATWNATRRELSRAGITALAFANATWSLVCVVMVARVGQRATSLGLAYILLEGSFCALLALLELRAVRGLPARRR